MFLVFCSFLVLAFASAFEPMSDGQDYIEPNFCRTQVLIGNLTLMHNGVKIYEYPMKWLQDNHRQKLKISIKGVADLMFTKFGRFVRRRDGDNFVQFFFTVFFTKVENFYKKAFVPFFIRFQIKSNFN